MSDESKKTGLSLEEVRAEYDKRFGSYDEKPGFLEKYSSLENFVSFVENRFYPTINNQED